jgi:hypothetical protein
MKLLQYIHAYTHIADKNYPKGVKAIEFKLKNFVSYNLRKNRLAVIQKKILKNGVLGKITKL